MLLKKRYLRIFIIFSPPNGCLQYHYATSGRIQTFNFADASGTHLQNQQSVKQTFNLKKKKFQTTPFKMMNIWGEIHKMSDDKFTIYS